MSTHSSLSAQSEREYPSPSSSRVFASLRKTDLLDILGTGRDMDSDRWSVAATLDDRDSEYSFGKGPGKSVSSGGAGDKESREEEISTDAGDEGVEVDEEEDRGSRFEEEEEESAGRAHFEHNGDISAPGQPQPSFVLTKTYQELVEENEVLHSRLLNFQMSQQQQGGLPNKFTDMSLDGKGSSDSSMTSTTTLTVSKKLGELAGALRAFIISNIGSQSLATETISNYVATQLPLAALSSATPDQLAPYLLEKQAFDLLLQHYLISLPFGGPNDVVLNSAYSDQLERFKRTLGVEAARWHRRSTLQSLSVDPNSRAYLSQRRTEFVGQLRALVQWLYPQTALTDQGLAERCAAMAEELSIEMHAGEADVHAHFGEVGGDELLVLKEFQGGKNRLIVSPLFVDEGGSVVLAARVVVY